MLFTKKAVSFFRANSSRTKSAGSFAELGETLTPWNDNVVV